jgi:2-methylisocitrate lyase-like PEP mutase family enzyme
VRGSARAFDVALSRALALQDDGAEIVYVGPLLQQAAQHLAAMRRELDDLKDRAVNEAARGNRRRSWTEIGRSLGVSRQAVQQKYQS